MKNLISPLLIMVIGPAAAVIFYVGGFRELFDRHNLRLVLFEVPIAEFFIIAMLRGRFINYRRAEPPQDSSRSSSILDGIEMALVFTAFVYFVFFQFGAK